MVRAQISCFTTCHHVPIDSPALCDCFFLLICFKVVVSQDFLAILFVSRIPWALKMVLAERFVFAEIFKFFDKPFKKTNKKCCAMLK